MSDTEPEEGIELSPARASRLAYELERIDMGFASPEAVDIVLEAVQNLARVEEGALQEASMRRFLATHAPEAGELKALYARLEGPVPDNYSGTERQQLQIEKLKRETMQGNDLSSQFDRALYYQLFRPEANGASGNLEAGPMALRKESFWVLEGLDESKRAVNEAYNEEREHRQQLENTVLRRINEALAERDITLTEPEGEALLECAVLRLTEHHLGTGNPAALAALQAAEQRLESTLTDREGVESDETFRLILGSMAQVQQKSTIGDALPLNVEGVSFEHERTMERYREKALKKIDSNIRWGFGSIPAAERGIWLQRAAGLFEKMVNGHLRGDDILGSVSRTPAVYDAFMKNTPEEDSFFAHDVFSIVDPRVRRALEDTVGLYDYTPPAPDVENGGRGRDDGPDAPGGGGGGGFVNRLSGPNIVEAPLR